MWYRPRISALSIPSFLVVLPALTFVAAVPSLAQETEVQVVEEIVAKVNDAIVTNAELAQEQQSAAAFFQQQGLTGAALQQAIEEDNRNRLRNKIDMLLLRQHGVDLGISVDDQINRQVADLQREFEIPDPEEFAQFVESETGQPYADFRDGLRDQIITDLVVRESIMRRITFTREESERYYNQHLDEFEREERIFLREIFIQTSGRTGTALEEANAKAQDLAERGKRGEAFAQMAIEDSESITKEQGGLLDPASRGDLADSIESLVWDAERGYVTDPIKLDAGWLILKVEDHQRAGLASFEEVEGEVQNVLFEQRRTPATRAFLSMLRENAFLQIKDGYVDSGSIPGKNTTWGELAVLTPETVTRDEVLLNPGRKRLLGMFPVPGTNRSGESSSR